MKKTVNPKDLLNSMINRNVNKSPEKENKEEKRVNPKALLNVGVRKKIRKKRELIPRLY